LRKAAQTRLVSVRPQVGVESPWAPEDPCEEQGETREAELKEGKAEGDTVSFFEPLNIQGNELRITYTGRVSANEIRFTRQAGNFSASEAVAKREAATAPAQPNPLQLPGKGALWRLASAESNGQNPGISNSPVDSVPDSITLPPFSVSIYELSARY